MGYGVQVALASQGEAVFLIDCSALGFIAGDLSASGRSMDVRVLFEASSQASTNDFSGMDNLVWSSDGNIYVNEDDGEGDIWAINVASILASFEGGDTTPDASQVYEILDADNVQESSGIIDISDAFDYVPGSIFLATGLSGNLANNQIALCVSPYAQLRSEVYAQWAISFAGLDTEAKRLPDAVADCDGLDNIIEFFLGLAPDVPDQQSPLSILPQAGSSQVSFTAARSLDLVDYHLDFTQDLSAGFTEEMLIRAADMGAGGDVILFLPKFEQVFGRVRAAFRPAW